MLCVDTFGAQASAEGLLTAGVGGCRWFAIANDITMGAGAFGPKEYAMFAAAANYGLAHRMPILYLAANSGARFGLAQEVQKHIQAWPNFSAKPSLLVCFRQKHVLAMCLG